MNKVSCYLTIQYDSTKYDFAKNREPKTFRIFEIYEVSLNDVARNDVENALLSLPVPHIALFPISLISKAVPRQRAALSYTEITNLMERGLASKKLRKKRLGKRTCYLGNNVWAITENSPSNDPNHLLQRGFQVGEPLRISCASLCRIKLDGNYLLGLNETGVRNGRNDFTPIGGGIKVYPSGRTEIQGLFGNTQVEFENIGKIDDPWDLRFTVAQPTRGMLQEYINWFNARKDSREIDPKREIEEELATQDHHHVKILDKNETWCVCCLMP